MILEVEEPDGGGMLTGERIVLRACSRKDVEDQHSQTAGEYETHVIADSKVWRPEGVETALARYDKRRTEPEDPKSVWFAVSRRDDPELAWVGRAGLWGIDEHNRTAHLGVLLAESARGQGLGTDVVRVLCDYAFRLRDLHRISLETLAGNVAMLHAARACGFVEEGRLRKSAYVLGERQDEVLLGLLRSEWATRCINP